MVNTFYLDESGAVPLLRSRLIRARHGFATRRGGVSTLSHTASLNLAFGRGDTDETVLRNLRRFADGVGTRAEHTVAAPQIHSSFVRRVSESDRGAGYFSPGTPGDGFVTAAPEVALTVRYADCVPILFEDARAGVIGAVHAGWRGTAAGIGARCVEEMVSLGASREDIVCAIGPAIGACCYEVQEDFVRAVTEAAGADFAAQFIRPRGGRLFADLISMNEATLLSAGLAPAHIDACGRCTACESELFFSHRASGGHRGTMAAMIVL